FLKISETPDCLLISDGVPYAAASNGVKPNGSEIDGITNKSAIENASRHFLPRKKPVNNIFRLIPSRAASSMSSVYCSPEPTIKNNVLGLCATTFAAASSK